MVTHSSILGQKIPWTERPTVHGGHTESDITEQLSTHNNMTIAIKKVNSKYEKNLFEPV